MMARVGFPAQVLISLGGYFPSARRPLQEPFLYEERLIYFFNGACFLAHRRSNSGNAYRPSFEFINDNSQYTVVHFIEPMLIYIQCFQCMLRNTDIDNTIVQYLREIAHPAQESVRDPGRTSTTPGYLSGGIAADGSLQYRSASFDDLSQCIGLVILQS